MQDKDISYDYIADQLDEVIDCELGKTRTKITREEIKDIVENVLWRCGIKIGAKDLRIKHEGYIDKYHRGLFVAVRDVDREGVHLYPLKPGQTVDIMTDSGYWETVRVERNPAAEGDPQALRVRLAVDDETPVIGAVARRAGLIELLQNQSAAIGKSAVRDVSIDMRPRAEIEAAKNAEIRAIEGGEKQIEHQDNGDA